MSNPILLIDSSGAIDITNPAFNRKLGYNPDELFGQPLTKIFEVEMRSKIESLLDTVKDTSHAPSFETSVITKSSTLLDVEVSLAFVEADTGYVVCTLYDISHLKEIERMKDQFVSMVSHELRTPITSMLLSSSTLRKYYDRLEDERKVRKITQINEQAELLAELVESILDISRLDARQEPSKYDHVDVAEALATVAEEMRGQAEQKEQHINLEIMTTHAIVRGEKPDFIRIWHNLLSNAVKYTQNGGEIVARIFVSRDFDRSDLLNSVNFTDPIPDDLMTSNYLIGMVEDNGFGMREADIPQLFTRFFRGWAAGSTITGTGLGLSLVRDLLNLYGGDIAVHSELGTGTTFCLWLPIEESDNEHLHSEGNKS